jgi:hypothetical protein
MKPASSAGKRIYVFGLWFLIFNLLLLTQVKQQSPLLTQEKQ